LRLLEAAMQMAPEAQFALREMCWSLARMLDEHIRHEVEALQPYHNRIQALIQARMAQDHADQQVVLRGVNALLLGGINAPVSRAVPPLAELIKELRHHMAQEEQEVFPMVDQLAEEQAAPSYGIGSVITETMTVNHVLHVHPQTREVFRAFKVNWEADGCHCLDELCWRRGVDVAALLRELNRSAAELEGR